MAVLSADFGFGHLLRPGGRSILKVNGNDPAGSPGTSDQHRVQFADGISCAAGSSSSTRDAFAGKVDPAPAPAPARSWPQLQLEGNLAPAVVGDANRATWLASTRDAFPQVVNEPLRRVLRRPETGPPCVSRRVATSLGRRVPTSRHTEPSQLSAVTTEPLVVTPARTSASRDGSSSGLSRTYLATLRSHAMLSCFPLLLSARLDPPAGILKHTGGILLRVPGILKEDRAGDPPVRACRLRNSERHVRFAPDDVSGGMSLALPPVQGFGLGPFSNLPPGSHTTRVPSGVVTAPLPKPVVNGPSEGVVDSNRTVASAARSDAARLYRRTQEHGLGTPVGNLCFLEVSKKWNLWVIRASLGQ